MESSQVLISGLLHLFIVDRRQNSGSQAGHGGRTAKTKTGFILFI